MLKFIIQNAEAFAMLLTVLSGLITRWWEKNKDKKKTKKILYDNLTQEQAQQIIDKLENA